MGASTDIGWTNSTWNIVSGCDEVSLGCDRCYAKTFTERWRGTSGHYFENGFDVTLRPLRMGLPFRWRKPRRIFVTSLGDLFHDKVPDDFVVDVFAVITLTPQHAYQLLTKRHARMRSLLSRPEFWYRVGRQARHFGYEYDNAANFFADGRNIYDTSVWDELRYLPNVHLGVSAEDQHWADIRIPALMETPAAVRFISAEPLIGPLNIAEYLTAGGCHTFPDGEAFPSICLSPSCGTCINWLIAGGESDSGARPMDLGWVRNIRDQCADAGVPLFVKQMGSVWARENRASDRKGATPAEWPEDLRIQQFPTAREPEPAA